MDDILMVRSLVDDAAEQNPSAFMDKINDILMGKISDAMNSKKAEIAQALFDNPSE